MGDTSPLSELYVANMPLSLKKNVVFHPVVQKSVVQKRSLQFEISISIISNSHLLREALTLSFQSYRTIHLANSYAGNFNISPDVLNPANHLVLIDGGIGRSLALSQIRHWRSLSPSPHVVVLELINQIDLILDCIEAGAHGYALQGASSTEIMQVIEQVRQGATQCSPEVTAQLFKRLMQSKTAQQPPTQPPLTRRELEVLHYVAKGYSDREIAIELVIEVRTVKHHVHNILRKLNVKHRRDAAQLAQENKWIDRA